MDLPYEVAPCPVCHSRDEEEIASRAEIAREMEDLWEFHLRRLRPETPQRFLADRVVFSQDPPLRLGRCQGCGTIFRNPRERGRELVDLYAAEELDEAVLRGLHEAQMGSYRAQARRLTRVAGGAGRALEVGSYVGGFQAAGRELGWVVDGVDVNATAAAFARGEGFEVFEGEIDAAPTDRSYDAVTIWNCFDQLPRPREVLRLARERLRVDGLIALRIPNGAFYAALRPHLTGPAAPLARALLAQNNLLGFPYRAGYAPRALAGLLKEEGFAVESVVGDTLVPTADRWTRGWARWEEKLLKGMMGRLLGGEGAPWVEIYGRAATRAARP